MKNVWRIRETVNGNEVEKLISIPPTLIFSARAKIDDISKVVTMDVKQPGDLVYIVGTTHGTDLGGSEYYSYIGEKARNKRYIGNNVPKVDIDIAKRIYTRLSEATQIMLCHSIHTPTLGGLGIALAQSALAGGYGMAIDLQKIPYSGKTRDDFLLFSQSNSRFVVTVPPEKKEEFEKLMESLPLAQIGRVTEEERLHVIGLNGSCIIDSSLKQLKTAWNAI